MNNRILLLIVPFVLASLAMGCSSTQSSRGSAAPGGQAAAAPNAQAADAPNAQVAAARPTYTAAPAVGDPKQYQNLQAVIETGKGSFTIEFFPKEAPKTVASFVKLSRDGFYDGLTFHRVEPGFVVQGGDPEGTGGGGPGYTLPAEFNAHKHVRGAVAMARTSDPNSAGSQFYVCLGPAPHLDGQYTVFGQVTKGMENVDKLQIGDKMVKVSVVKKP